MTKKATKRALLSSALALVVCISMLIGTTYAWFTDSVTSTNNIIKSGNLDVVLEYKTDWSDDWTTVENNKPIFKEGVLYEPGYTEVVYLRVSNAGTLALKYNLMVNIVDEVGATNVAGETFKLSDYLMIGSYVQDEYNGPFNYADILMPTMFGDRENAIKNVKLAKLSEADSVINADAPVLPGDTTAQVVALVLTMPESVGNEANYRGSAPQINLGINLFATQFTAESDSFGTDYDAEAPAIEVANTAELQAALDNATLCTTIKLLPGVAYDAVVFRPTAANVSKMVCNSHPDKTYTDAEEFKAHMNDGQFHHVPYYTTELLNAKIIGAENATIDGFTIASSAGNTHDYVLDADRYIVSYLNISNLTFENVAFTGKVNIESSLAESSIQGVTFDGCSFTTGGTDDTNGQAIRYYNENNDGQVKNLVVKNCTFYNCRHGVYVQNVNTVTVTDNVFDTTGHNAIALQGSDVNLKNVVIARNAFKNIGDRIIRFNTVGADSNITIQDNVATNSGDSDNEVIKANSIAAGVTTSVKNNIWGAGKIVVNDELKDENAGGKISVNVSSVDALDIVVDSGNTAVISKDIVTEANTETLIEAPAGNPINIDGNGSTITTNGIGTAAGSSYDYGYVGFIPANKENATVSNVKVVGSGFVEVGHYGTSTGGNYTINNLVIEDLVATLSITNCGNNIAAAFSHYGIATMTDCVMTGTTTKKDGYKPYDAAFVNGTKTTIIGGEYGNVYLANQAHVTVKAGTEIDVIDSYAIVTNNLGKLVIESGANVGTINLYDTGKYKATLTIENGANVGAIVYNGVTYTVDEWLAIQ